MRLISLSPSQPLSVEKKTYQPTYAGVARITQPSQPSHLISWIKRLLPFLFLSACGGEECCRINNFQNITNLPFHTSHISPSNIQIDAGNMNINIPLMDKRISNIADCIKSIEQPAEPSWDCVYPLPTYDLSCLKVKVVPPTLSACSSWEFIGVPAPNELCEAKGLTPSSECPCMWRLAVQDDWTIITPSALYFWDVGRVLTSCNNIWETPYEKCLML